MLKFLIIFCILIFYNPVLSSIKEKVIYQMQLTNNLSFNFIQTVNNKSESGKCVIKYPKKIYCEYLGSKKKFLFPMENL